MQVLSNTSDIILIQEHWLWPFELHSLSSILSGFTAHGLCDRRLNKTSELLRGCGGIAILWKKSIAAHPIHLNIDNDRICGIELPLENHIIKKLLVFNIYFPSTDTDYSHSVFWTWRLSLTCTVMWGQLLSLLGTSILILAHWQVLEALGPPIREVFLSRSLLFISSHAQVSSGSSFTYHSGDRFSTVDYIVINRTASDLLDSCGGLFDHPLNVSDHLPLFIALQVHYSEAPSSATMPKINWEKAISTGSTDIFAKSISNFVLPFLSSSCDDATQLEQEISIVCEATCKIATTVLPHFTDHKKSTREFYSDHQLKQLCKESKSSWKEWRNAGRPLSGNILENKNLDKKKVRARINLLSARKERLQQSEQIDQNFRRKATRFRSPGKGTPQGTRLSVDGSITTNHQDILDAWATHFKSLGTSKIMESASLQQLQSTICSYRAASQRNEDFIMDVPSPTALQECRVLKQ